MEESKLSDKLKAELKTLKSITGSDQKKNTPPIHEMKGDQLCNEYLKRYYQDRDNSVYPFIQLKNKLREIRDLKSLEPINCITVFEKIMKEQSESGKDSTRLYKLFEFRLTTVFEATEDKFNDTALEAHAYSHAAFFKLYKEQLPVERLPDFYNFGFNKNTGLGYIQSSFMKESKDVEKQFGNEFNGLLITTAIESEKKNYFELKKSCIKLPDTQTLESYGREKLKTKLIEYFTDKQKYKISIKKQEDYISFLINKGKFNRFWPEYEESLKETFGKASFEQMRKSSIDTSKTENDIVVELMYYARISNDESTQNAFIIHVISVFDVEGIEKSKAKHQHLQNLKGLFKTETHLIEHTFHSGSYFKTSNEDGAKIKAIGSCFNIPLMDWNKLHKRLIGQDALWSREPQSVQVDSHLFDMEESKLSDKLKAELKTLKSITGSDQKENTPTIHVMKGDQLREQYLNENYQERNNSVYPFIQLKNKIFYLQSAETIESITVFEKIMKEQSESNEKYKLFEFRLTTVFEATAADFDETAFKAHAYSHFAFFKLYKERLPVEILPDFYNVGFDEKKGLGYMQSSFMNGSKGIEKQFGKESGIVSNWFGRAKVGMGHFVENIKCGNCMKAPKED